MAARFAESGIIEMATLLFVRHATANEIGDFVGGGIQSEVADTHRRGFPDQVTFVSESFPSTSKPLMSMVPVPLMVLPGTVTRG